MSSTWFESIAEAQRRAKKRLPGSVYSALIAGSEKGLTLADNLGAFDELRFAPRTAGLSGQRELGTTRARPGRRAAGADLPDRRPGGAPRRRSRRGEGGGRARDVASA